MASATLTDTCLMPFGQHKGKKMANVPAGYLLYIHEKNMAGGSVKNYIESNIDALHADRKKETASFQSTRRFNTK